jgi:hypothetical protein
MRREDLKELHYITAMKNVNSILQLGILSHRNAKGIEHESIAMQEVQDKRAKVRVPGGKPLHTYANLYICARNPMLFYLHSRVSNLCVLRISSEVLDLPGVIVTDGNAASKYTSFRPSASGLSCVDRNMVFAEYWTHDNTIEHWEHSRIKCAEVLIPDRVDSELILGSYVPSATLFNELVGLAPSLDILIDPHLFFV